MDNIWTDDFGNVVLVHAKYQCKNSFCTIHNPSDHSMVKFPQLWRDDKGMVERVCSHGIGHPDPDELDLDIDFRGVHGCDGCCSVLP